MVRVGKWDKKGISFGHNIALPRGGIKTPNKKLWWGTITKRRDDGTVYTVNMGVASYGGFSQIEWSIVYCTAGIGSAFAKSGTVSLNNYVGMSLFLPATLGLASPNYVFAQIFGR